MEAAAGIAGLIALAELVVNRGYKYYSATKGAIPEIKELLVEVNNLYGILNSLNLLVIRLADNAEHNSLAGKSSTMILDQAIVKSEYILACRKNLETLQKHLSVYDPSRMSKMAILKLKLLWPLKSDETSQLTRSIQQNKDNLQLALQVDEMSALLKILKSSATMQTLLEGVKMGQNQIVKSLERIHMDQEKTKILDWCSRLDPKPSHKQALKCRSAGTAQWFAECEVYQNWRNTKNSRLWLFGIPGGGKTVMTPQTTRSSVIEHIQLNLDDDDALAFHYCNYKSKESQSPENILCSLIRQVSTQSQDAFDKLRDIYDAYNQKPSAISSLRDEEVHEIKSILQELSRSFDQLWIIIDGVDECMDVRVDIAELMDELSDPTFGTIKVAVSSRPEIDLEETLGHFGKLEIAASRLDVQFYVVSALERNIRSKKLRIREAGLKEIIMERLVDGAQGMFQWVVCQIDYLCRLGNDKARRNALDNLPPGLNATYQTILERAISSELYDRGTQEYLIRILRWISFSECPLSLSELSEAVSDVISDGNRFDPTALIDEETIMAWGGCLLRLNKEAKKQTVEFSHYTVKDFLLGEVRALPPPLNSFRLCFEKDQPRLAKICFRYLLMEDFRDIDLETSAKSIYKVYDKYQFLRYADRHWSDHARFTPIPWDPELALLSERFFDRGNNPYFFRWRISLATIIGLKPVEEFLQQKDIQLDVAASLRLLHPLKDTISKGFSVNSVRHPFGTSLAVALHSPFQFSPSSRHGVDDSKAPGKLSNSYSSIISELLEAGADPNIYSPQNELTDCFFKVLLHHEHIPELSRAIFSRLKRPVLDLTLSTLYERIRQKWITPSEVVDLIASSQPYTWTQQQRALISEAIEVVGGSGIEVIRLLQLDQDRTGPGHSSSVAQKAKSSGDTMLQPETTTSRTPSGGAGHKSHAGSKINDTILKIFLTSVKNGMEERVRKAIDTAPELLNATDIENFTAMHHACAYGYPSIVAFLLNKGAMVNPKTFSGYTPLHLGCHNGHLQCIQLLLNHGADLNSQTAQGHTPLMELWLCSPLPPDWNAISDLLLQLVPRDMSSKPLLLSYWQNIDLSLKTIDQISYTHLASRLPSTKYIEHCLKLGPGPHVRDAFQETPLHAAARNQSEYGSQVILTLLQNGALLNSSNYRNSPLLIACRDGTPHSISTLINAGADIIAADTGGLLPQHHAAKSPDPRNLEAFIDAARPIARSFISGIDGSVTIQPRLELNLRCGRSGNTVLHYTMRTGKPPRAIMEFLANLSIMPDLKANSVNRAGETALIIAATLFSDTPQESEAHSAHSKCRSLAQVLTTLLKITDTINELNSDGWSALCYVFRGYEKDGITKDDIRTPIICELCWEEVFLAFTQHPDFRINDKISRANFTPLLAYLKLCDLPKFHVVRRLVGMGADVTAEADTGETALHLMLRPTRSMGQEDPFIMDFLIAKGSDVNWPDCSGETPLIRASATGSTELVNILLDNGADVDKIDNRGFSALLRAVNSLGSEFDSFATLQALLENNASLEMQCTLEGETGTGEEDNYSAFQVALRKGHLETIELMLNKGKVDTNYLTKTGKGVWHAAVESAHPEIAVQALASRRIASSINAMSKYHGGTPLALAIGRALDTWIITILVDFGANVSLEVGSGSKCLDILLSGDWGRPLPHLQSRSSNQDYKDRRGWALKTLSIILGSIPRIKYATEVTPPPYSYDSFYIKHPGLIESFLRHHENIHLGVLYSISGVDGLSEECLDLMFDFVWTKKIVLGAQYDWHDWEVMYSLDAPTDSRKGGPRPTPRRIWQEMLNIARKHSCSGFERYSARKQSDMENLSLEDNDTRVHSHGNINIYGTWRDYSNFLKLGVPNTVPSYYIPEDFTSDGSYTSDDETWDDLDEGILPTDDEDISDRAPSPVSSQRSKSSNELSPPCNSELGEQIESLDTKASEDLECRSYEGSEFDLHPGSVDDAMEIENHEKLFRRLADMMNREIIGADEVQIVDVLKRYHTSFESCKNMLFDDPDLGLPIVESDDDSAEQSPDLETLSKTPLLKNGRNPLKLSILQYAIKKRQYGIIKELLHRSCFLSVKDSNEYNGLAYILRTDDVQMLNQIVEYIESLETGDRTLHQVEIFDAMGLNRPIPFNYRRLIGLDSHVGLQYGPMAYISQENGFKCAEILIEKASILFNVDNFLGNCEL